MRAILNCIPYYWTIDLILQALVCYHRDVIRNSFKFPTMNPTRLLEIHLFTDEFASLAVFVNDSWSSEMFLDLNSSLCLLASIVDFRWALFKYFPCNPVILVSIFDPF